MAHRSPSPTVQERLSELPDRVEFERRLTRAMTGLASNQGHHCLAYLFLDRLSDIGHQTDATTADTLLQQIVQLIALRLRTRDTLARLESHALGLLLEHCPEDRARELLWSLSAAVADHTLVWQQRPFQTTLSVGLVTVNPGENSVVRLLSHAEVACHIAREHLAGGVYVYQDNPPTPTQIDPAEDTPDPAMQFSIQALVPLRTGIPGWHRLVVNTPRGHHSGPRQGRLDRQLLNQLNDARPQDPAPLLIPLSLGALADPGFVMALGRQSSGPGDILVEIPWSQFIGHAHLARQALRDCQQQHLQVLVSGFPGSLTAFQQLQQWSLAGVIVDTQALGNLQRTANQALLGGLVTALKDLALTVILDGLDHPADLPVATALGADLGCGRAAQPGSEATASPAPDPQQPS